MQRWMMMAAALAGGALGAPARSALHAQPTSLAERYFATLSVGSVLRPATCDFCTGTVWPAVTYRVGRTLEHDLVIGVEGTVALHDAGEPCTVGSCANPASASFRVMHHSVMLQWYPSIEKPYFLKGGFGVATNYAEVTPQRTANEAPDPVSASRTSLSVKVGGGVERRLERHAAITLHADLMRTVKLKLHPGNTTLSPLLLFAGFGITWYFD